MTRKDYIKFAEMLKNIDTVGLDSDDTFSREDTRRDIAMGMCRIFAEDNPNFDRDKFLTAAEIND